MGLLDNLLARWGYQRKTATISNPPGWLIADAGAEKYNVPSGALFEAQAELMQRLSWVNIAVSLISRSAAVLDLNVLRMEGEETVDIPNHDFEKLLWHPNPLQSRFEFLESTFAWRCLTGNCYWWLNRASEKAEPSEIWIIPSNKIAPVPDERQYIKGYVYDYGAGTMPLEPWEIVHFKSFHPLNPWVGLSPIEALAIIATADLEMQKWNLQLFGDNAARLPGILAFASNINDPEWARMKQDINDKASKRQIMMLRNTQSGGVQFIQAAVSQKDMEFLASRQATKEEIFNAFGPGLVAMLDKNATEANARSAKATFTEYTLWPLLDSVAQKQTQDILPAYGENLRAQFDDPRVTDRVLELQEQAEYSKVHTLDEIREKYYGDPPLSEVSKIEDDKRGVMLPAQVSPTTPLGDEPEPEPQPEQLTQPPEAMDEQTGEVEPDEQEEKKGGPGSGNFGHSGRPGEVGGSGGGIDGNNDIVGHLTYGQNIYKITDASNLNYKYGAIVVNKNNNEILAAELAEFHSEIVETIHPDKTLDDYVRFTSENGILQTNIQSAGVAFITTDDEISLAIDNIYNALDKLVNRGLPPNTRVVIAGGKLGIINTTAKYKYIYADYIERAEIARWRRKTLRLGIKRKVEASNFESENISSKMQRRISAAILAAETEADLKAAFRVDDKPSAGDDFAALLAEMKRANDLLEASLVQSS